MWLKSSGFGSFHSLADLHDHSLIQEVVCDCPLFQELPNLLGVERFVDLARKPLAHVGPFAVADRLDEEVAQFGSPKHVTEDIENGSAERLTLPFELLEEAKVYVSFARLVRTQVPHVADFGLADAVDPPEALLKAVGVPRKVVIDHQMGALEVDPFAGSIRRHKDGDVAILGEPILHVAARIAVYSAVNRDYRLGASEKRLDAFNQVADRVAVLGEDDELPPIAVRIHHVRLILQEVA